MSDVDSAWPDGAPPAPGSPFDPGAPNEAGSGDGVSVAMSALAIVGLLLAIFALWISRCDVDVIDRLVESLPGAFVSSTSNGAGS